MFFIKGYYFLFAAIIYTLVGICEGINYLNKLRFHWPAKRQFNYRNVVSLLHLDFSKG